MLFQCKTITHCPVTTQACNISDTPNRIKKSVGQHYMNIFNIVALSNIVFNYFLY